MKLIICTFEQHLNKYGIHSNCPDSHHLTQAFLDAAAKGFDTIYAHFNFTGIQYRLPYDVLRVIVSLGDMVEVVIEDTYSGSTEGFSRRDC